MWHAHLDMKSSVSVRFRDVNASILPDSVDCSLAGVEEVSETGTDVEEEDALRPPNLVIDRDEAERAPESVPVRFSASNGHLYFPRVAQLPGSVLSE